MEKIQRQIKPKHVGWSLVRVLPTEEYKKKTDGKMSF